MQESLFKMIFYYETGALSDYDIIQWAMNQVVNGNESETISELANINRIEPNKVKGLFHSAIQEKEGYYPDENLFPLYRLKLVGENIISGKITPNQGVLLVEKLVANDRCELMREFETITTESIESMAHEWVDRVKSKLNLT